MRKLVFFTLMLSCFSVNALPNRASIQLELDRSASVPLAVRLKFSEPVRALDYSDTPYAFVSEDWRLVSDSAHLNHSALTVDFQEFQKQLDIEVTRANDRFLRGFYTPFLNFSDGGAAIYVAHYLPKRIKTNTGWKSLEEIDIDLTINAQDNATSLFSGQTNVTGYRVSPDEARQYAYIGVGKPEDMGSFNAVFDPNLPPWIRAAYSDEALAIFQRYESKTGVMLPFKPLLIVNFNGDDVSPRFDGGAISKQISINFVGSAWTQNPQDNKLNILRLWAHEAAHLWNSQYWHAEGEGAVWLSEGGANYFARAVLFDLGYLSREQYHAQSEEQVETCNRLLEGTALAELRNRGDHYICGEAILYRAADHLKHSYDAFGLWNAIVNNSNGSAYSVDDLLVVLERSDLDEQNRNTLVDVVRSIPGSKMSVKSL